MCSSLKAGGISPGEQKSCLRRFTGADKKPQKLCSQRGGFYRKFSVACCLCNSACCTAAQLSTSLTEEPYRCECSPREEASVKETSTDMNLRFRNAAGEIVSYLPIVQNSKKMKRRMTVFTGHAVRNRGSVGNEAFVKQSLLQLEQWRVFRLVKNLLLTTYKERS